MARLTKVEFDPFLLFWVEYLPCLSREHWLPLECILWTALLLSMSLTPLLLNLLLLLLSLWLKLLLLIVMLLCLPLLP